MNEIKYVEMNDYFKNYVLYSGVFGVNEEGYVVNIENEIVDEGYIEEHIEYIKKYRTVM